MNVSAYNYPVPINVRKLIKDKGLKQQYVAKKAGFQPSVFGAMLNGRKIIKASDIPKIADALDVEPGELLNTDNVPNST